MTPGAIVLCSRATPPILPGVSGRTVLAALSAALLEALCALGAERAALLARVGLSEDDIADPDRRIALDLHLCLLECLPDFGDDAGLRVGVHLAHRGLGVIGLAMEASRTVGDALALLQRYRALVLDEAVPRLAVVGDVVALTQVLPPRVARLRLPAESQAAATVTTLRALADSALAPTRVCLPHAAPADPRPHAALFRCPIEWGALEWKLVFPRALLDRPLSGHNPALVAYLARRAEALRTTLRDAGTVTEQVRRAIDVALVHGEPALAMVARRLAMSGRSLQRRLHDEATSFAAVLDEVRRARAFERLVDPALSVAEVAFLLGYTEPAAFHHAFKRWTNQTPQQWRAARSA